MARFKEGKKREDLITAAKYLFMTEGVEKVSVSKIVKKAGVAQGTFYLYFNSKNEILDAVAEEIGNDILQKVYEIGNAANINAYKKIVGIKQTLYEYLETPAEVVDYFHDEKQKEAHDRLSQTIIIKFIPVFQNIITQGINENIFNIDYPAEAAYMLLSLMSIPHEIMTDKKALQRWDKAVDDFVSRGLGVKGSSK